MSCRSAFYLCLTFCLCLVASNASLAQESDPAPTQSDDTKIAVQSEFEEVLAEWQTLEEKLKTKEVEFYAAGENVEKKTAISETYNEMVADAKLLVSQLKDLAMEELEKDATNKTVLRTLMGIAMNAAAEGDDEQAMSIGEALIAKNLDPRYLEVASGSGRLTIEAKEIFEELMIRQAEAKADDLPRVKLTTAKGEIIVELFENEAPDTVGNFISLVRAGYYDGLTFHRVMDQFMAQAGKKEGGPGYQIYDEFLSPESRKHFTGYISMANTGMPNSGSAEFFLTTVRTDGLDGKHTVFGKVISGMDVVRLLTVTYQASPTSRAGIEIPGTTPDTIEKAEVIRAREHEYQPKKVTSEESDDSEAPKTQPDTQNDAGGAANSDGDNN